MVPGAPFTALCDIFQEKGGDFCPIRIVYNTECPLDVDNLEFLNCTLKGAKLIQPFCRILGRNIDLIPARGSL